MGDTITFKPNTGVNPTFTGRGSKLEHPDLLPIFRGAYWPGGGGLSSNDIMKAIYTITSSPYLSGLTQYGYVGPVNVRNAMIDNDLLNIPFPAAAPGVRQTTAIDNAVRAYVKWLVDNDRIDNVDDNHELLVMVFLDPGVPLPVDTDAAGNVSGANGANSSVEIFEFLDDNIRFEWAWVNTSRNDLAAITKTFCHELVEAVSDPFGSGWVQTSPAAGANAGQIGDVCNQPGILNGFTVSSYWSVADNACIIPTSGSRRLALSQSLDQHAPHDGPKRQGYVDFPIICGGGRYFDYVERTYRNLLNVHAKIDGYESPRIEYKINGQAVPLLQGAVDVDANWDEPQSNPIFPDVNYRSPLAHLTTWNPGATSDSFAITVGQDAGNVSLRIEASVSESFDNPDAGGGSTKRTAILEVDLKNQEILWGSGYDSAKKNCQHNEDLANQVGVVIGPPQPGDPANLADIITQAVNDQSASRAKYLRHAAKIVEASRPEVAHALKSLADRSVHHQ